MSTLSPDACTRWLDHAQKTMAMTPDARAAMEVARRIECLIRLRRAIQEESIEDNGLGVS